MTFDKEVIKNAALDATRTVFDPEIPAVSIYDLGLIYDVDVSDEGRVHVKMTLTSPSCPAAQELPAEVYHKVSAIEGVKETKVDVVFDPPWSPANMADHVKLALGMM